MDEFINKNSLLLTHCWLSKRLQLLVPTRESSLTGGLAVRADPSGWIRDWIDSSKMAQNMKPCVLCICPSEVDARIWVASGCWWNEMTGLLGPSIADTTNKSSIQSCNWIRNHSGWSWREADGRKGEETRITGSCILRLLLQILAWVLVAGQMPPY